MNFSWSQPQQKEEKPPFQISESMTMNDLTPEIKKEFIEVYNEIKNAKKFTITQKKAEQSKESNEAKGSEESYQQALFKNDPPAKMSILKVHFL